jgi:hypothetical protein
MKIKSLFVAVLLMAGVVVVLPNALADDSILTYPTVESFDISPADIDLSTPNAVVKITVIASHPIGIFSKTLVARITNGTTYENQVILNRTDAPIDLSKKKVVFEINYKIPLDMPQGAYSITVDPVSGLSPNGGRNNPTGNAFSLPKIRDLAGAENALLIRSNGDLAFDFQTFVGPSYESLIKATDNKPIEFGLEAPIWKVGENLIVSNYFQKRSANVDLKVSTSTPSICSSDGQSLKFIEVGTCNYKVYTPKTLNYLEKKLELSATITTARGKQEIGVTRIATQDIMEFPKIILVAPANSSTGALIVPTTTTPGVCLPFAGSIKIVAGGTCTLKYQGAADSLHLASDVYSQSFEILVGGKSVVAPTPTATPTPVVIPTPTAAPVVKKTISCVKGKKTVTRTGSSPKCPAGYKLKK